MPDPERTRQSGPRVPVRAIGASPRTRRPYRSEPWAPARGHDVRTVQSRGRQPTDTASAPFRAVGASPRTRRPCQPVSPGSRPVLCLLPDHHMVDTDLRSPSSLLPVRTRPLRTTDADRVCQSEPWAPAHGHGVRTVLSRGRQPTDTTSMPARVTGLAPGALSLLGLHSYATAQCTPMPNPSTRIPDASRAGLARQQVASDHGTARHAGRAQKESPATSTRRAP